MYIVTSRHGVDVVVAKGAVNRDDSVPLDSPDFEIIAEKPAHCSFKAFIPNYPAIRRHHANLDQSLRRRRTGEFQSELYFCVT